MADDAITSEKVDFKKTLDSYQARRHRFRVVDVPPMQYLMIDGRGDPNSSPRYADAIEALYPVAYSLKATSKLIGRDYVVPPLEALWWADDMGSFTTSRNKAAWYWTLMIMVPDWIDRRRWDAAVEQVAAKGGPALLGDIRLETLSEGCCVQTLHVGSFDDEAAVLDRMHREFIPGNGLRLTGRHHEIYFSDARRVADEKLRTVLRQPVEPAPRAARP